MQRTSNYFVIINFRWIDYINQGARYRRVISSKTIVFRKSLQTNELCEYFFFFSKKNQFRFTHHHASVKEQLFSTTHKKNLIKRRSSNKQIWESWNCKTWRNSTTAAYSIKMMEQNGYAVDYGDAYMEQEEEWEREGLLDPAWEKQQKKVTHSIPVFPFSFQPYLAIFV